MSGEELKVDGNSISGASSRLKISADGAQNATASALHRADHLAGTAGRQVFAALVDGVFDALRAQLPNDIARLVESYANGLLEISNAAGATDQALSISARGTVDTGGGLAGAALVLQAAGGSSLLTGGTVVDTWKQGAAQTTLVEPPARSHDAVSMYGSGAAGAAAAAKAYVAEAGLYASSSKAYQGGYGEGYADKWGAQSYNCTSWAEFRRSQLGLSTPSGDGSQMAGNVGAIPASQAHLGSLVSLPPTTSNAAGHVLVVEKVLDTDPPRFTVSQMNYDNRGSISTDSTLYFANGEWFLNSPEAKTIQKVGTPTFST